MGSDKMIPDEIIDQIREAADIVEIIGEHLSLKKSGANFRANCPFHTEKTPSFMVSPSKRIWHCFGCGLGGNVFSFLMKIEGISFFEVLKLLAKRYGISLPEQETKEDHLKDRLYKINALAVSFYQDSLFSPKGERALSYLNKRGFKKEIIREFKLGYSQDKWDGLFSYLSSRGISSKEIEACGLIIPNQTGSYYDRFRGRIIFPIFDQLRRPIGFGARVLDNSLPKYINSPETSLYHKGKNLYGLSLSKEEIRKENKALIVEGYLDCLKVYQEGFKNVVATLGTALTSDQARLLRRYGQDAYLLFDPDAAGAKATLRSFDLLIGAGLLVKIVSLPSSLDPDAFLSKEGRDGLDHRIEEAENFLSWRLRSVLSIYDPRTIEGKVRIIKELSPTIEKVVNKVEKGAFIKEVAEALNMDERIILEEIRPRKREKQMKASGHLSLRESGSTKAQRELLGLCLEEEDILEEVLSSYLEIEFSDPLTYEAIKAIKDLREGRRKISLENLLDGLSPEAVNLISGLSLVREETEEKSRLARDYLSFLKKEKITVKLKSLEETISTKESKGEIDSSLLREYNRLARERAGL